jgi:hypothetical protein
MRSAVTVESDSAGEHFQLTLEKAANDQGTIRIRSWRSDQDHNGEGPDKDDLGPAVRDKGQRRWLEDRLQGVKCLVPILSCHVRSKMLSRKSRL